SHSSAKRRRLSRVRFGIAPSEWLTRYVQVSRIGNSARQARSGSTSRPVYCDFWLLTSHFLLVDGHIYPHGFELRVVIERMEAHLAAESALLVAAEGGGAVVHVVGVDPDGAR